MPVIHTNRRGTKYYLHTSPKRGGGIRYFLSTKPDGPLVDEIPDGFEIHETVNAAVHLRRRRPKLVREEELEELRRQLKQLKTRTAYRAEAEGREAIIHESTTGITLAETFRGLASPKKIAESAERWADYQAVLRFVLVDEERRVFAPERFCFGGSVEDWIPIGPPGALPELARKYFKHLGKDSIYELY
jgi:hypothetical protein